MEFRSNTSPHDPLRVAMQHALFTLRDKQGQPAVRQLLESVAGVTGISEVPQDKIQDVIDAAGDFVPKASIKARSFDDLTRQVFAKWNSARWKEPIR